MGLGAMLTSQILRNEITVEQARASLLHYHRRKARPKESKRTMAEIKELAILQAIERNRHNLLAAARELGISRNSIYRHARKLGMLRSQV
jgi:transcriptional regulator of acetoin/glycerol metabolism